MQKGLKELETLHIAGNKISDITPLLSLPKLVNVKLGGNNISKIPINLRDSGIYVKGLTGNPLEKPLSEGQSLIDYCNELEIDELLNSNSNSSQHVREFLKQTKVVVQEISTIKRSSYGRDLNSLSSFDAIIKLCNKIIDTVSKTNVAINYTNQLTIEINKIKKAIPFHHHFAYGVSYSHPDFVSQQDVTEKIDAFLRFISNYQNTLESKFTFFRSIGFFNGNAVLVGANGSGKTSLSNAFRKYLHCDSIVVSSQRIMCAPHFDEIASTSTAAKSFEQIFTRDRSVVDEQEFKVLQQEFATILRKLLADNANHRIAHYESSNGGKTTLDRCLVLWNSFNSQRKLVCKDGINITVQASGSEYPVIQMSDGEKAMLYLISLVLLAPTQSIIVVDEPEMHLHRTITDSFWDTLEGKRKDCRFIYLTHDLDFATSRTDAEKIWIKSFTYPERWETEAVPKNEIPEALLLELLGSRKNILFCEGNEGGYDKRIYAALFPDFTVTPVKGCGEVVKYTKAFNSVPNGITHTVAYGLVDADYHHPNTLKAWGKKKVFGLRVPEIENLLLDSTLLKTMGIENAVVDKIKVKVKRKFDNSVEVQASKFASRKLIHYFREEKFEEHRKVENVIQEYKDFSEGIDIYEWYKQRLDHLSSIDEHNQIIRLYEGKDLTGVVSVKIDNQRLQAKSFEAYAVQFIESNVEGRECLYQYFPEEITRFHPGQVTT